MRLQDLAIITELPLDTDKVLFEKFKSHDRVVHDSKTDLYSYRVRSHSPSVCVYQSDDSILSMTSMSGIKLRS